MLEVHSYEQTASVYSMNMSHTCYTTLRQAILARTNKGQGHREMTQEQSEIYSLIQRQAHIKMSISLSNNANNSCGITNK